ncbi:MAG: glycosyltransferase family 2 protein [Oscillospiraceae bacterium]|jgi:cellulose synthase/poly-beta-1,6-N-acetylglucosamine synthase-like glycosyltransferase|nr:glycosyltransferase family 2 protein [Oscillospiraceae bacterium]
MLPADVASLYAIITIWLFMAVYVFLSIGGFRYFLKCNASSGSLPPKDGKYPMVSVLVPAHNEALVLSRTVRTLLKFDYPKDRYEIIVINDNSTDRTKELLQGIQREFPDRNLIVISTDRQVGGDGKSNALNIGFSVAKGSVIAVYDADNTPEPSALRLLTENLIADDNIGAVIGKFRTRNRNASLLTRFVNIETLCHQCMNQAGRYFFFKLCTIPGTNYVIRRSIIERIGGWDVKALSEDTEISFRIYRMGYYIKFLPQAVTWEQEPHLLSIWFRQRTRWAKGNLYVLIKNFKYTFDHTAGSMRLDTLYFATVYVLMLSSLITSDIIFLGGLMGFIHVKLAGFSSVLWGLAIVVFIVNMMLMLALERNEFNLQSAALVTLMLFTYAKLWVFVMLKAVYLSIVDQLFHREVKWDKTVRYEEVTDDENSKFKTDVTRTGGKQ